MPNSDDVINSEKIQELDILRREVEVLIDQTTVIARNRIQTIKQERIKSILTKEQLKEANQKLDEAFAFLGNANQALGSFKEVIKNASKEVLINSSK